MMKINDIGEQQGTVCIDLSQPQSHYTKMTLATNIAIVFTNTPPKGRSQEWMIEFVQDGKGGKTVTFPASLTTTPRINLEPNATSPITFSMKDGNNIQVQNYPDNKIDIEEEDIILDWKGIDEIHIFYSEEQLGKKLKQQILQDHEDAKKWNELENAKTHEALTQYAKNRQIVKRLEEHIKNRKHWKGLATNHTLTYKKCSDVIIQELQEILEGRK